MPGGPLGPVSPSIPFFPGGPAGQTTSHPGSVSPLWINAKGLDVKRNTAPC